MKALGRLFVYSLSVVLAGCASNGDDEDPHRRIARFEGMILSWEVACSDSDSVQIAPRLKGLRKETISDVAKSGKYYVLGDKRLVEAILDGHRYSAITDCGSLRRTPTNEERIQLRKGELFRADTCIAEAVRRAAKLK